MHSIAIMHHYEFNRSCYHGTIRYNQCITHAHAKIIINTVSLLWETGVLRVIDKYIPTYKPKERKNLYTTPEVFNLKKKKNKLWKVSFNSLST